MKRKILFLAVMLIAVAGCQSTPSAVPATFTPTLISPTTTPTSLPPTLTPTFVSTNTPTQTPRPTQTSTPTIAPEFRGRYTVVVSSAQDELNYIWGYLRMLDWYDQYGYKPLFPSDPIFQSFVQRARAKQLGERDYYETGAKPFTEKIYNATDYEKGYQAVLGSLNRVEQALPAFHRFNALWGFKVFPQYTVRLTLYGTGGSFNPQNGTIILQTNLGGTFVRGPDAAHTIIHESVHIGVEESIAQKFSLAFWARERLVDRMVYDNFLQLVPSYRIQPTGDASIEKYLDGEGAWDNLPQRMSDFKNKK